MNHVRNAREGDADILMNIGLRAWQKAMAPIGDTDALLDSARDAFSNFIRDFWLTITVVEKNGAALGWAAREGLDETISDFWIDPASLRQGLGLRVLAHSYPHLFAR